MRPPRLCGVRERGTARHYALYARRRGRRVVRYVPDVIAAELQRAVRNGRTLHELLVEAGERYLRALKAQRRA